MDNKFILNGKQKKTTKTYRSDSTWFLNHLDPILRNDFSCRSKSTEKLILAVTDPFKNETREREKEWGGEQNFSKLVIDC